MSATLLLSRADVERLLAPEACIAAVEDAFRGLALGKVPAPGILGMHGDGGGFHVKAGFLRADRDYFAAKLNANFPGNAARGLPTIQGAVLLYDAADGRLLAILDSIEITVRRTAAASALAARYLARKDASTLTICGCGGQARAQLEAIARVRPIRRAFAWDLDAAKARSFARDVGAAGIEVKAVTKLTDATTAADIIVTATTSTVPFITPEYVHTGTFIAAVGADNPHKSELHPDLFTLTKWVADSREQAAVMGDLHHAIAAGLATPSAVHADLAEIVAGRKPGRTSDAEITVFDSTGLAIQDVASAAAAYERFSSRP
jgi:alanine dehydrogenase